MHPWKTIANLSPQESRALQSRKLAAFIQQYIYPLSPYYRKIFDEGKIRPEQIKSVSDLKRIPFISKANFIDKSGKTAPFREFILQPDKEKIKRFWPVDKKLSLLVQGLCAGRESVEDAMNREFRPVFTTFTGGTTGQPIPFMYSNYDMDNLKVSGARMIHLFNIKSDEKLVNIFPYAPHLAFWQVFSGGLAANVLCLHTGGGKVLGTEANINAITKTQPSVILGVPSYVYHLLREAKERGVQLKSIKKVVLGAARVSVGFKMKLAEVLSSVGATGVSIFGTYGFTEARCAWAECPSALDKSMGYHLYPDKEIIEIVDPETGEVKGEGEDGEIVYTGIDARASAVIRYRTGDFARGGITYEPCPGCGSCVPRLSSDITRLSDTKDMNFSKIKGTLVNLSNFESIMAEIPAVEEWQIEIRKKNSDPFDVDEMAIYVSTKSELKDKVCQDVKAKVQFYTEVSPNAVVAIARDEMVKRLELETANKERRILDVRPKD